MSLSGKHAQLPLALNINHSSSLENFICADNFLIDSLKQLASHQNQSVTYLWGTTGSGKTHCLQAVCQHAGLCGWAISYLPLAELTQYPANILEGMETASLVCVDDIHCLSGQPDWQQALFNLFNSVHQGGGNLLFSGLTPPRELGLSLADLVSRLEWGPVFHLSGLKDEQKIEALKMRARERGLELENEPARFLLNRFPRNLNALFEVLDKLDQESLVKQRRITIPFIREVFAGQV